MKRILSLLLLAAGPALIPQTGFAQAVPQARAALASAEMDVQADKLEYKGDSDTVIARGNVIIRKGRQTLKADLVTYNTTTEDAYARGNVVFANDDQLWQGQELRYNFITGQGSFPNMDLDYDKFKIRSETSERISDVQLQLKGVVITTCADVEDPEFKITATTANVYEERVVSVKNAVFYLRGIPVLYLPRYTVDLDREATNLDLLPGYSSRDGVFLLTGYNIYHTDNFRTKTHVDYRSERGFAFGEDLVYFDPIENRDITSLRAYYAMDEAPYRNDAEETRLRDQGVDVEDNRYRLQFRHQQDFDDAGSLRAKASYLSDARVVQDFFNREFREEPIPENRATYSVTGEGYTASLEVNKQINDEDFGGINRIPEGVLTVPRMRLGDSPFLYESSTRAGLLERTYSEFEQTNGSEDYDTTRLHTRQMAFYPTRHFGWLNLTPRAGGTLTVYGDTKRNETRVTPVSNVGTNGVITTTFQTNDVQVAASGDNRILPELGFETSFKAFGEIHDLPTGLGRGLRHVVEPFANVTYIPEPDLTQDEIYQFDSIDTLGEANNVAFGVRNKLQTKIILPNGRHKIHDYADVTVRTVYDMRSEVDEPMRDIRFDSDFRPTEWFRMEFDANYDNELGEINRFNSEIRAEEPETKNYVSLNQRYRVDRDHVFQIGYGLNPGGPVGLEGYTRYESEDAGLEEQTLLLTLVTECVGYGIGGSWIKGDDYGDGEEGEDDFRISFQLWLTAFPRAVMDMGGR